jgi:small-conductance mechanosensitive channel
MDFIFEKLRDLLQDDLLYRLILILVTVIISYLVSKFLAFIIKKIIKPFVQKTKSELDDILLNVSGSAIYRLTFLGGIYLTLNLFEKGIKSESKFLDKPLIKYYPFLENLIYVAEIILFVVLIIIILNILFKVINLFFDWYAEKINAKDDRNLSGSLFPLLKKLSKILLFLLAFAIVLAKLNIDISAFVVSLGVGSLAIALAAQESISNMISGFIIMIDRPFRIGDRIRYADNQIGDVVEIGIRSTKIQDFDNNIVVIPNNEIVKSRLVNFTYPTTLTRVVVNVGVAYGSDINKVKEVLIKAAESDPAISTQKQPAVYFLNFGAYSLDFRLVAFTDHYSNAWDMECRLREKIYELFKQEGIEIPFPQTVIHKASLNQSD